MTLSIRAAQAADGGLIHNLVCELAQYERLLAEVEATPGRLSGALFAPRPRVFCDIAEWCEPGRASQPAGFALWFYNFSTFRGSHGLFLEDLFVRPAFRGKGIGKALLAHLARRCVAEGLARLEWAVLDWNKPAIAFYQAQGAVMLDDWTGFRVTGAALLRLAEDNPGDDRARPDGARDPPDAA